MLSGYAGILVARATDREMHVGPLTPERADYLPAGVVQEVPFTVWLDVPAVEKLEQLRIRGDGHLHFRIFQNYIGAVGWASLAPASGTLTGPHRVVIPCSTEYRYVRDDWLEALKTIGYRSLRVYEAPEIEVPKDWNVADHLDTAWRVLHQGYPDDAMQECRKALEGVTKALDSKGFVRKDEAGKLRIDFRTLTGSETLGDTLDKMYGGARGFQDPGQHHGKAIRYEDGEFAVLSTHALVNYIARLILGP